MDTGKFEKTYPNPQKITDRGELTKTISRGMIVSGYLALGAMAIGGIILIISIRRRKVKYNWHFAALIIVLNTMSFLFYALVAAPNIKNRREFEKNYTLIYNLKKIGEKLQGYANDNNGCLPPTENWCDILLQYDKSLTQDDFRHPKNPAIVIAFNENLSGVRISNVPKDTVLLFETRGGWNLSGDEDLIQTANSNDSRINILFANMVVKSYWIKEKAVHGRWFKEFVPVRWKP